MNLKRFDRERWKGGAEGEIEKVTRREWDEREEGAKEKERERGSVKKKGQFCPMRLQCSDRESA